MKTRLDWFENLPQEIKEKALANTLPEDLCVKYESLGRALEGAFDWRHSPEGLVYWYEIFIKL